MLRLDDKDFKKCREDIYRIRERVSETGHLFYDEMITSILKTHILDLYDIHARNNRDIMTNSRPAALMRRFIGMLVDGDYETDRTLEHYSSRLCITPHYLSEISQMLSCRPATYWIDRFVINEISRLLVHKELSLTDIAERLGWNASDKTIAGKRLCNHCSGCYRDIVTQRHASEDNRPCPYPAVIADGDRTCVCLAEISLRIVLKIRVTPFRPFHGMRGCIYLHSGGDEHIVADFDGVAIYEGTAIVYGHIVPKKYIAAKPAYKSVGYRAVFPDLGKQFFQHRITLLPLFV